MSRFSTYRPAYIRTPSRQAETVREQGFSLYLFLIVNIQRGKIRKMLLDTQIISLEIVG